MLPRQPAILNVVVILGIGVACFLLFLLLLPNFEASRAEARLAEAYYRVRQISNAHIETPSRELFVTHKIPHADPWGQPYRLIEIDVKQVRALSSGPNMLTPKIGVDHDDIYSDMLESPVIPIHAKKKRQLVIATGFSAGIWLLLGVVYLRSKK